MRKHIIPLLMCCFAVLTACSNKADTAENTSLEISQSAEASTEVVTELSVAETQTPTESETEAPTEAVFPDNFTEIPENAAYKQISYYNPSNGVQGIIIHFFDKYDNEILTVTEHNGDFKKAEYSYEYNEDGTVAQMQYLNMYNGMLKYVYTYNPDSTLAEKNTYINDEFYGTDTYTYDGHKEPVRRESAVPDEDYYGTSDYSYEYDQQGRVIRKTFSSDLPYYYAEDNYTYDYKGNIKTTTSGSTKIIYSYDENNRLIWEDHYLLDRYLPDVWQSSTKYEYEFY